MNSAFNNAYDLQAIKKRDIKHDSKEEIFKFQTHALSLSNQPGPQFNDFMGSQPHFWA